ncbi:hypothetical protein BKA65DRAFT_491689 [Rhexocercosporidium sp. MPI-PUGE-AT-0058]|nr:hypothetical protein BKA65DRAFT_491689 [Rhexocercosporidium sp. MPI-PUGE-AT-0058]
MDYYLLCLLCTLLLYSLAACTLWVRPGTTLLPTYLLFLPQYLLIPTRTSSYLLEYKLACLLACLDLPFFFLSLALSLGVVFIQPWHASTGSPLFCCFHLFSIPAFF